MLRADDKIVVIPRLKQRIEVMLLCRRFDIQLAEILPDLGILKSAAVEIKSSTRLRDVLAVSPTLGTRLMSRRC
jgi:diaphanous 1